MRVRRKKKKKKTFEQKNVVTVNIYIYAVRCDLVILPDSFLSVDFIFIN